MIVPTNGRIVWYHPGAGDVLAAAQSSYGNQPLAAIVTHVWNNHLVNLCVFSPDGVTASRTSVTLVQDDDGALDSSQSYCAWMPFQLGQAERAEAAEKAAAAAVPQASAPAPASTAPAVEPASPASA
jgi:hypothetical protein